jgi:hypothetical protein
VEKLGSMVVSPFFIDIAASGIGSVADWHWFIIPSIKSM